MKKYIAALLLALTTSVSHAALIEYKYTGIDSTFDASSSLLDYINNSSSATTSNASAFDMVNSETQSVSHISFEFTCFRSRHITTKFEVFGYQDNTMV